LRWILLAAIQSLADLNVLGLVPSDRRPLHRIDPLGEDKHVRLTVLGTHLSRKVGRACW
jgi:hypothetical protein